MKKINERFYQATNGLLFDIDTNCIIKPLCANFEEVISLISKDNHNLNRDVLSNAEYADGANFAINLNLTSACNLDCTYCFARGGDYGEQKDNMSETVLPTLKNLILNNVSESKKVRFEYFGGEPLLNESMICSLIEFAKVMESEYGIHILHRVSTNLTSLSEKMLDIICENNFVVSVSIDGIEKVHDKQRPSRNGKSSFKTTLSNIKKIKEKNSMIRIVARMTIAQREVTIFENLCELIKTGLFNYASIYPASIISIENGKYEYYFDEEIKKQYHEVFVKYGELFKLSPEFRGLLEIEKILDSLLHGKLSVSHCSAGKNYCTLSSDGSVVTCHRLCGNNDYMLNCDGSGILDTDLKSKWSKKVDDDLICSKCFARYICGGGCKQEHIGFSGDIEVKSPKACEFRKFLLEEIITNIDELSCDFDTRYVSLDDMFVYCGRPVVKNHRIKLSSSKYYEIY